MYYLSHTLHFNKPSLYTMTWAPPQPSSDAGAISPPLTMRQLKANLRCWLQMLAQHVPDANVMLVGTHDDGSAEYQSVRLEVEAAVDAEIEHLNSLVVQECSELQKKMDTCESDLAKLKRKICTGSTLKIDSAGLLLAIALVLVTQTF